MNVSLDEPPAAVALESNASYVVADLGRKSARMMVSRGARHMCASSRRTLVTDEHRKIEHGFQMISPEAKFHCRVCDIANASEVDQCIAEITLSNLPVVRGVVHAAIVMHGSSDREYPRIPPTGVSNDGTPSKLSRTIDKGPLFTNRESLFVKRALFMNRVLFYTWCLTMCEVECPVYE